MLVEQLHLISPCDCCVTRKIAKGCGAFMGQNEGLYAGKQPIPRALPRQWTVVALRPWSGGRGGARPIGANLPHGAMRSGLAIGEVQTLLNPHTGSGDRPPTSAWVGNAEYPPPHPGKNQYLAGSRWPILPGLSGNRRQHHPLARRSTGYRHDCPRP